MGLNVYVLVDRSGSMQPRWEETANSIDEYVKNLKKKTKIFLSVFDTSYDVVAEGVRAKNWTGFDRYMYNPRGMTALYDAAGKLFTKIRDDDSEKGVVVVLTDGQENASREYNADTIKKMVKEVTDRGWEVIFLGNDFSAVTSQASDINISASKVMNRTTGNYRDTMRNLAAKTVMYASTDTAITFSDQERADAVKSR